MWRGKICPVGWNISARGLRQTLEHVWRRIQRLLSVSSEKLILAPRQERLLCLLLEHGGLTPAEIWKQLKVSRQGAIKLIKPLLNGKMIEKRGNLRSGRYFLTHRDS